MGFVSSVRDWAIYGELVMDGEEGAGDESSGGFMGCKMES